MSLEYEIVKFAWILCILLTFWSQGLKAQSQKIISSLSEIPQLQFKPSSLESEVIQFPYVAYGVGPEFEDPIVLEEAIKEGLLSLKLTQKEVKFGYSNEFHGIFIHLAAQEFHSLSQESKFLVFNHYIPGMIHIYRMERNRGEWSYVGKTGSAVAYRKRLVKGLQLGIPLKASSQSDVYYFISRHSHHRFDAKARIITKEQYFNEEESRMYGYMLYIGALLSLILFNLLLFFSLKDAIYLYYSLSALSVFFTGLCLTGVADFLFASFHIVPSESLFVFSSLSVITSTFFASKFYSIKEYSRPITQIQYTIMGATAVLLLIYLSPLNPFFGGAYLGVAIDILIVVAIIMMMVGAVVSLRRGNTMAKFYLFSWLFMFIGAFTYIGHYVGILPRNFLTGHGVLWGNLLEMIIVSLGMAYKISILDHEKKEALVLARGKKEYQKMVRVLLHDLSNPISLIQYYTKLKFDRPQDFESKSDKAWEKISFGLTKLGEIISFHREQEMQIDKLTRTVVLGPVLIREVFIEVELMFEEKLDQKNIRLSLEGSMDVFINAERVSLVNEVFNNILSNAIKFSPVGSEIKVKVETTYDQAIVIIEDEGKGFSEAQMNLFESGEIIESTIGTIGEKGTGFGLSLVRGYMKVYEGDIQLKHRKDEANQSLNGASIWLYFNRV